MMTIDELYRRVRVRSGNYMVPASVFDLVKDDFRDIVEDSVGYYSSYQPKQVRNTIEISTTTHTYASTSAPQWISEVNPLSYSWGIPNFSDHSMGNMHFRDPRNFPWDYIKPTLYVPHGGRFDVLECHDHKVVVRINSNGDKLDINGAITTDPNAYVYDVDLDATSDTFMNLILGHSLMTIGSGRGGVRLESLQVSFNAEEMFRRGEELYRGAKESLQKKAHWWLAWG